MLPVAAGYVVGISRTLRAQTFRQRARRCGALLGSAVLAGVVLATPATADHDGWVYLQTDQDACWDAVYRDDNRNNYVDHLWYDLDNDCRWDSHLYNTLSTEFLLEEASFDFDENGRPEHILQDADQRVGYEYLYSDRNQDGVWDSIAPLPGTPAYNQALRDATEEGNRRAIAQMQNEALVTRQIQARLARSGILL